MFTTHVRAYACIEYKDTKNSVNFVLYYNMQDMKKLFILLSLAVLALPSYAQDLITKKNGTDIQAKVLEVSTFEVKYKAWDNLEGPTFILPTYDILIIRFENGTNHVFGMTSPGYGQNGGYYTSDMSILGKPGLRYRDLKHYYSRDDYGFLHHPRYGLGMPWLNLIFPGLSQYCMNEPGLGTRYLLISLGCTLASSLAASTSVTYRDGNYVRISTPPAAEVVAVLASAGLIATEICSIVNAYRVAKVKSLYSEDLRNYRQGYSMTLAPFMNYAFTPSGVRPAPGIGVRVTF